MIGLVFFLPDHVWAQVQDFDYLPETAAFVAAVFVAAAAAAVVVVVAVFDF